MKRWARRVRGALGTGLAWAAGWAAAGVMIGVTSLLLPMLPLGPFFEVFDAPLPALAIPGFVGGIIFSLVLGVVARHRTFDELSVPRFAAWGALGGFLLSLVPTAFVALGLATPAPDADLTALTATIAGPFMVLSAVSAAGSLVLARRTRQDPESAHHDPALAHDGDRRSIEGGWSPRSRGRNAAEPARVDSRPSAE